MKNPVFPILLALLLLAPPLRASAPRLEAVGTNLAYDAFAILNLRARIALAPRIALDIPVAWSLWDWRTDLGLRTVALQPRAMYHLGATRRLRHSAGVTIGAAWYNFRRSHRRYQDTGMPLLTAGIAYSCVLPLADRWFAELSLSAGYAQTRYREFVNIADGAELRRGTLRYFGPTELGISLCYTL